jgi:hypothetical protein
MRCCVNYCLISRCPPPCFLHSRKWSQDATNQARNSSRHRIIRAASRREDFGVGLLAG